MKWPFGKRKMNFKGGRLQSSAGVTLLELLVVIAIAAAALAIGVMSTQDMRQGYQMRTASRRVFADMQKVRLKAIKEGKVGSFTFDEANDSYIYSFAGEPPLQVDLKAFGVNLYNSTDLNFNGNGTAGPVGAGVSLQVLDHCQRVYISSLGTGNVKIKPDACP